MEPCVHRPRGRCAGSSCAYAAPHPAPLSCRVAGPAAATAAGTRTWCRSTPGATPPARLGLRRCRTPAGLPRAAESQVRWAPDRTPRPLGRHRHLPAPRPVEARRLRRVLAVEVQLGRSVRRGGVHVASPRVPRQRAKARQHRQAEVAQHGPARTADSDRRRPPGVPRRRRRARSPRRAGAPARPRPARRPARWPGSACTATSAVRGRALRSPARRCACCRTRPSRRCGATGPAPSPPADRPPAGRTSR